MKIENRHYNFFADLVFKLSGMHYQEKDYYRLDARIISLCKLHKLESVDDLVNLYQNPNSNLINDLINEATNNETYFYRDKKPFEFLVNHFIPQFLENSSTQNLSIWSCACSSGQEVYSTLMEIDEHFPHLLSSLNFDASDISRSILDKAESGNYTNLEVQRGLPIKKLMKYFENQKDSSWTFKEPLKSRVKFKEFNLISGNFPKACYDVIFCRNVLIYQNSENRQIILDSLSTTLKSGGIIIMGAGESLLGMKHNLSHYTVEGYTVFQLKNLEKNAA